MRSDLEYSWDCQEGDLLQRLGVVTAEHPGKGLPEQAELRALKGSLYLSIVCFCS